MKNLNQLKVPASSIQRVMHEEHRLPIQPQDVHNLNMRERKRDTGVRTEVQVLSDYFESLLNDDPGCTISVIESEGVIEVIYIQTSAMRRVLNSYPQMLFVDGTYCVNKHSMPLYVFAVCDGNGQGQVVSYALVKDERASTLRSLFREFEKFNPLGESLKTIMTDKDLNEIAQIKQVFPSVNIMLCRFHVQKAFKSGIAAHCHEEDRDVVRDLVTRMVYSSREIDYDRAKEEMEGVSATFSGYFDANWDPMKEMWAGYIVKHYNHRSHFTNNIVESHNHSIKAIVKRRSSIVDLIKDLFKLQSSIRAGQMQRASNMVMKVPSVPSGGAFQDQTIVSSLFSEATDSAARRVYEQLNKFARTEYGMIEDGGEFLVRSEHATYRVQSCMTVCSCHFYVQHILPCAHIFFIRQLRGRPIFATELIPDSLKKSQMIDSMRTGRLQPGPGLVLTSQNPTAAQPMKCQQKFSLAMEEMKLAASRMSKCNDGRFEQRMALMRVISDCWNEDDDIDVSSLLRLSCAMPPTPAATSTALAPPAATSTALAPPAATSTALAPPAATSTALAPPAATSTALAPPAATSTALAPPAATSTALAPPAATSTALAPPAATSTAATSSSSILSGLENLSLPPPAKIRGRPKGAHLTVLGKRKRKRKAISLETCPKCGHDDDGTIAMICCDRCQQWYHFPCVGVRTADEMQSCDWLCVKCVTTSTA